MPVCIGRTVLENEVRMVGGAQTEGPVGHSKDAGFCSYYDGAIGCFLKGRELLL